MGILAESQFIVAVEAGLAVGARANRPLLWLELARRAGRLLVAPR
jgi:hypothetical protein